MNRLCSQKKSHAVPGEIKHVKRKAVVEIKNNNIILFYFFLRKRLHAGITDCMRKSWKKEGIKETEKKVSGSQELPKKYLSLCGFPE